MQLVIWFAVYVMLVLGLATWRNHHDLAVRSRKHKHPGKGPTAHQPDRGRERHPTG